MKITLFFCAGNLAEKLEIRRIDEMDGTGWKMPWTMSAFTVGAFGMIGVPPLAGFVSKWYLCLGALESGQAWVVVLLAISSLLNAAYFLPIVYRAWFKRPSRKVADFTETAGGEIGWSLLSPPVLTAALVLLAGVLAASEFSPLAWAEIITTREFKS